MGKRHRASCSIANHEITGTRKPSGADDVQVPKPQPACETAPATTQDLLIRKGATAWQTMKPAKNLHVLTCISNSEESDEE